MSLAPDIVAGVSRRLAEHAGLELPAWVVEARTIARIAELDIDPASYVELIATARGAAELAALVEAVRVGESSLFRHLPQISALVDVVVPSLRAKTRRAIRVWSAGCATGEEPYTLAAVLSRAMPNVQLTVLATDVSADALERARDATYPADELRDVPDEWRDIFVVAGDTLHVHPSIASLVTFERANLLEAVPPRSCDLVWCRNVLIYFSADARRRVVDRLVTSLVPGGYLFVGYSETLRDIPQLETIRHGDCVFYAKPEKETTSPGVDAYRTPPYGARALPRTTAAIPIDTGEEREVTTVGVPPPPSVPVRPTPVPTKAGTPGILVPHSSSGKSSPNLPQQSASKSSPNLPQQSASKSSPNLPQQSASNSSSNLQLPSASKSSSNLQLPSASKPSPTFAQESSGKLPILATRAAGKPAPAGASPPSLLTNVPTPRSTPLPTTIVRVALEGQPNPQQLFALIGQRLSLPEIERLVLDLDSAEMLSDDLAPVIRRARAAASAEDVVLELVATKPGTKRWLSRHGFAEGT